MAVSMLTLSHHRDSTFCRTKQEVIHRERASQGTSVQLWLQAAIQGESTNFVPIFVHRHGKLDWHWGGEGGNAWAQQGQ